MPHVPPTLQQFRARFGEFGTVLDETVEAVMADALASVSTAWVEADYPRAIMLLTAHLLLAEGHIDRAAGKKSTVTTTGVVTSKQVGDVRVTYSGPGGGSGGKVDPNGYGSTEYGRRFLALKRANFAGPMVA